MENIEEEKILSKEESTLLEKQNTRLVPEYKAAMLEKEAKRHWDLFYKRNETRFFKDRHWTKREFVELIENTSGGSKKILLEIGCGVGNLVFPLIQEGANIFVYACDFSIRAINFVKSNKIYDEDKIYAFQTDITSDHIHSVIENNVVDIITLVFVLSAIHPNKFSTVVDHIYKVLKPGGIVLFRDYGLYDMAQLRFKPGHKISENFYMRQDGTRSYYFSKDEVSKLFSDRGFAVLCSDYVHRRTINKKEDIDVPRIFIQAKFLKL